MAIIKNKRSTLTRVSAEEALFEYAKSLKRHSKGRRGVLVNISCLTRYSREARHLRSALEAFDPLMSRFPGQIFELCNEDLVCVLDGASFADIDEVILRIRYLFRDDENLKAAERNDEEDILCRWFDIGEDYIDFLDFARARFESDVDASDPDAGLLHDFRQAAPTESAAADIDITASCQTDAAAPATHPIDVTELPVAERLKPRPNMSYQPIDRPAVESPRKRPLQPMDLAKVESALETMDVENLVRRQNICLIGHEHKIRPIIVEHFIPILALERRLLPETDIASNPWLIQHLRGVLDLRMLSAIHAIRASSSLAVSLRCTIDTILSQEFEDFRQSSEVAGQQRLIIEISAFDLLANPSEYLQARKQIRDWGFRVCIGDMEPMAYSMLDRHALAGDFEKMRFRQDLLESREPEHRDAIRKAIQQAGAHRVILCACDSEEAVQYGQDVGIRLFQGSAVDSRLKDGPIAASV